MQIRFLVIEDDIRLLGLPLKLSPTEPKLLRAIAENQRMTIEDLAGLLNDVSAAETQLYISQG